MRNWRKWLPLAAWCGAALLGIIPEALADEAPKIDTGDTAWMLTSTALVLMMTIPGLALFYGGMVRKMNVLATVMQSFAICCLVAVLWMVVGYSIAFGKRQRLFRRPLAPVAGRHGLTRPSRWVRPRGRRSPSRSRNRCS